MKTLIPAVAGDPTREQLISAAEAAGLSLETRPALFCCHSDEGDKPCQALEIMDSRGSS